MKLGAAGLGAVQRIVRLQRDEDGAAAALGHQVEAVVEELAEERHPRVERCGEPRIRRNVWNEQNGRVVGGAELAIEAWARHHLQTEVMRQRVERLLGLGDGVGGQQPRREQLDWCASSNRCIQRRRRSADGGHCQASRRQPHWNRMVACDQRPGQPPRTVLHWLRSAGPGSPGSDSPGTQRNAAVDCCRSRAPNSSWVSVSHLCWQDPQRSATTGISALAASSAACASSTSCWSWSDAASGHRHCLRRPASACSAAKMAAVSAATSVDPALSRAAAIAAGIVHRLVDDQVADRARLRVEHGTAGLLI